MKKKNMSEILTANKNKWTLLKAAGSVAKIKAKDTFNHLSFKENKALDYCYHTLEKVSRSFAVVIKQLDAEVRDSICIFYLVLRALDTVEDDLNIPFDKRMYWLRNFHLFVGDESFSLQNVGDHPDYVGLMENYPKVAKAFNGLDEKYQSVIEEITFKMGNGMADFTEDKVNSLKDYDQYCHYVAGLVGIGLSKLFAVSGIENPNLINNLEMANSMGLFLQKTNITRDFAEDVEAKRFFWPKEIWNIYTENIASFLQNPTENALSNLNHMVNNALIHFTDCLDYLEMLQNKSIFKFCAIPQVMALSTLRLVYNNPNVLSENVKLEKSDSTVIFTQCENMEQVINLTKSIISAWELNENTEQGKQTKILLENILNKIQ